MSRGRWLRAAGGLVLLGLLVWRLGGGPFLDGLRSVDARALLLGLVVGVPTTVCCAWRWRIVARGLGVGLPLRTAVAACYRSQLVNAALPGGVLGDVHRGVRHGRRAGSTGRGLRAVMWERAAGQVVQGAVTAVVLLALPSPVAPAVPTAALAAAGIVLLAVLPGFCGGRRFRGGRAARWGAVVRAARDDVRTALLTRHAWPGVLGASLLAVTGHVATFLVAARAAGVTASPVRLVPLALLVLVAMAVPLNVAGWGPREGMAAWGFGAAGLGADAGVATAVVYGVIVLVAGLPGALPLSPLPPSSAVRRVRATGRPQTNGGRQEVARG